MEKDRDAFLTKELGRSMRFFLNLSSALIITFSVLILCLPRPLTPESLVIALIPVIIALIFFLVFLRLLKLIETDAAKEKDIELRSRVIWEFNKSWVIRSIIGKIKTFIDEK